jgi:hypothetical protein
VAKRSRSGNRNEGRARVVRPGRRVPVPIVALGVILLVLGGATLLRSGGADGHGHSHRTGPAEHPEPRLEANASLVVSPGRYVGYPRIAEVYRQVAEIPQVIDGLYCYCDCKYHSDHHSLFDCFRDDHGAGCDICLTQAALAHRMTLEGRTLQEIRDTQDRLYGS